MSAFAEVIAWVCVALAQLSLILGAVLCYLARKRSTEAFEAETAGMNVTGKGATDLYEFNNLSKAY